MISTRHLNEAAEPAASQIIFVDPSGRRWQRVQIITAGLAALLLIGILVALPHLNDTPALTATDERLGPPLTSDTTGKQVPVIGQGPLVRVLDVQRDGGQVSGLDPSTKAEVVSFTPADRQQIGSSAYVIQRFGYSDTAQRTISLTFDDGPDLKWTPELLDLLSAENVPATFFATGTMVARNPEHLPARGSGGACGSQSLPYPRRRQHHPELAGATRVDRYRSRDSCRDRQGSGVLPAAL